MTLLTASPPYSRTHHIWKCIGSLGRWFSRLVDEKVAAFLAHREYQATLAVLHSFSDRELRDMGLHRGQIGPALEDAGNYRASRQKP